MHGGKREDMGPALTFYPASIVKVRISLCNFIDPVLAIKILKYGISLCKKHEHFIHYCKGTENMEFHSSYMKYEIS